MKRQLGWVALAAGVVLTAGGLVPAWASAGSGTARLATGAPTPTTTTTSGSGPATTTTQATTSSTTATAVTPSAPTRSSATTTARSLTGARFARCARHRSPALTKLGATGRAAWWPAPRSAPVRPATASSGSAWLEPGQQGHPDAPRLTSTRVACSTTKT
jgi:hypothetical protein